MNGFMDREFLLDTQTAQKLFTNMPKTCRFATIIVI